MTENQCPIEANMTDESTTDDSSTRRCCRYGFSVWCHKYWWEGQDLKHPQALDALLEEEPWHRRVLVKYRRVISFCIPAVFFHFFWWLYFIKFNAWHYFVTRYPMSITMIFGSIIAGMTSEGGGAVAFPVMTLALKIHPSVARDFSCMIQSCGMTSAAFTIFFMHVRIEWNSIICCSIGGIGGAIFGLHVVDPALSPTVKKLGFVSIWFAFASVLIFLNRVAKRRTFKTIQHFNWWKCMVLVLVGFVGGTFTSFSGSGLDICSFMILTLLFRISEKIATPTSVILMGFNSLVVFYWRLVMLNDISDAAWEYLGVCIPFVVIGAPLGSVLGSHFHRLVLAMLVIVLDTIALISAFAIVRPLTFTLVGSCVLIIVGCFVLFMGLTYAGQKLLEQQETREKAIVARGKMDGENQHTQTCKVNSDSEELDQFDSK